MSEEIRKVQHYHTKTANNKPSATNMLDGEIAVNMSADNEKLFIKNTNDEIVEFLPADKLATVATSGDYNDLSNKPTIPTKTSDLTNDSNFGKVASFEWDGATMSGTLSQDKYNEIAAADIVYIELGGSKVYFMKDINSIDSGVIKLSLTTFGEPFPIIGETVVIINADRTYTVSTNMVQIPTKITDLDGGGNLLETTDIKTVNGESIVKSDDGVTDIKTQLAYAEYTGTSATVAVTTKYGYFPTTLVEGTSVAVKFEGSISYITTLNVNGTGAKNVYYKGNSLTSGTINRYNTYLFIYDGSYYRIIGINTDTDTHYTAKNVVASASTITSDTVATNGNVHLNLIENSTVRSKHKIVGSGATTVTSDSSGNITIDTPLKTINGESIVGSGDITIEGGGNLLNVATTANTGVTKLVTGDLSGKTYTDGEAAAAAHTHSQYIETNGNTSLGAAEGGINIDGSTIDIYQGADVGVIISDVTGDEKAQLYSYGNYVEATADRVYIGGTDSSAVFVSNQITISTNETAISLGNSGFDIEVQEDGTDMVHTLTFNDLGTLKVNGKSVLTDHQDISGKQDKLVSGTNIKTINGTSILGSGNIEISGGSGSSEANVKAVDIDENLDDVEDVTIEAIELNDIDLMWDKYFNNGSYGSASAIAEDEIINSTGIGDYDE